MKFTWKPIKDLNNLPRGFEIMVCIPKTKDFDGYCEYIYREGNEWFYVYSGKQIQEHKLKAFTHYFIPRPFEKEVDE